MQLQLYQIVLSNVNCAVLMHVITYKQFSHSVCVRGCLEESGTNHFPRPLHHRGSMASRIGLAKHKLTAICLVQQYCSEMYTTIFSLLTWKGTLCASPVLECVPFWHWVVPVCMLCSITPHIAYAHVYEMFEEELAKNWLQMLPLVPLGILNFFVWLFRSPTYTLMERLPGAM